MKGEKKIYIGLILAFLAGYLVPKQLDSLEILGVILGTVIYGFILIDTKIQHILKVNNWD